MINDTATLRTATGALHGLREAVIADGPETESFLQGQLSQDIAAMAPGDSAWSLLLQPQGKISAWLRVTRLGHERFLLDVDATWGETVIERLSRFKLRTKCDLTLSTHRSVTIIGPDAAAIETTGGEFELHDKLAGVPVIIVFGPDPDGDLAPISHAAYAALRIEAGRPAMGTELDESTIPASAGIVDQSVSFTKGCYTGQELVARIDSRGNNVPRRLVGLVFETDDAPPSTAGVTVDGDTVGTLTTSAVSAQIGGAVAMAYVARAVADGAAVDVAGQRGEVRPLPLIG